jgi:teichuronic acid biosynthesis glycosyltransferase TuaH
MSAQRSYVIYAPTAWDGQRQLVHNLAEALAMRHRVLYVDPPVSPLSPIRYGLKPSTWPRLRAVLDRRVRTSGGLQVFSPLVLPPVEHPRMRALSRPLLRAQIAHAVKRASLAEPIVLATRGMPELAGAAREALRVGMFADHPSAGASLMGRDAAALEADASAIYENTDLLCTTSHSLVPLFAERGWHSEVVSAGFAADLADTFDQAVEPAEYAQLPRPLLGYTGSIDDRLDFDVIVQLADHFEQGSLVFVGPVSPRLSTAAHAALAARANIHLLGLRSRTQLPAYIRYLDVALLPYKATVFTRYQSPMKFWEYLYAGAPIVGTGSTELRRYPPPLVNYAESAEDALAMVDLALADPAGGREQRRRFALANTWGDRANELDALVTERLSHSSRTVARECALEPTPLDVQPSTIP